MLCSNAVSAPFLPRLLLAAAGGRPQTLTVKLTYTKLLSVGPDLAAFFARRAPFPQDTIQVKGLLEGH